MQDADLDSVNDGLSEAIASIPSDPAPEPDKAEPAPSEEGQPRDERGRFKSEAEKAEEAKAESAGKQSDTEEPGGQIPSWRLREIREERDRIAAREAEKDRELEAMRRERAMWQQHLNQQRQAEQAPQRPDPINEPEAFAEYIENLVAGRVKSVEESNRNNWVNLTFAEQHEANGETFEKAMQALEQARNPQIVASIKEAVNPGKALMKWYREHTFMSEVGGDPEGYRKRLREQLKKDPEFRKEFMADLDAEARSSGRSSENVTSLPSLNRAPGGAGRQQLGDLGGSDKEIFENLTRKRG